MLIYDQLIKKYGLSISHLEIINFIKSNKKKKVLDIGCASGYLGKELVKDGFVVDGVEKNPDYARLANKVLNKVYLGSIEDSQIQKKITSKYDAIICADILEHLVYPEKTLREIISMLAKDGILLISLPNIAFWQMRFQLLKGSFKYQDFDILDRTHLRFFTYYSAKEMFSDLNLRIIKEFPHIRFPIIGRALRRFPFVLKNIENLLFKVAPNFFSFHFTFVLKKKHEK